MRANAWTLAIIAVTFVMPGCTGDSDAPDILATFYPVQYLVSKIANPGTSVASMIAPGVEPHDWEPSPKDVQRATKAKVFVMMSSHPHHSPDAFAEGILGDLEAKGVHVIESATVADFGLTFIPEEEGHGDEEEEHDGHDEHEEGGPEPDPHIWLDPSKMKVLAKRIGEGFAAYDPGNATSYASRTADLEADLDRLDQAYQQGLANCLRDDIITAHAAFAYLAARYGFNQHGISGLSPEVEPSPAKIRELIDLARTLKVKYVFFETLVAKDVAETIAREAGAKTLPLNPIEGLTEPEARAGFHDYDTLMRNNLDTLRIGLECY